jgi:hypothetical protein
MEKNDARIPMLDVCVRMFCRHSLDGAEDVIRDDSKTTSILAVLYSAGASVSPYVICKAHIGRTSARQGLYTLQGIMLEFW